MFLKNNENENCKKILFGKDINEFKIHYSNNWVDYNPDYMKIEELRRGGGGLRLRNPQIFERKKLLTRQTADRIIAALDLNHFYYSNTLHGTTITDKNYDEYYVLAILNSTLLNWYYQILASEEGNVFAQVKIEILRELPIRELPIDTDKLNNIIDLSKELVCMINTTTNDFSIEEVNQNRKILDNMIFEIYNLNETEISYIIKNET